MPAYLACHPGDATDRERRDYSPRTRVAPAGMHKYFEEVLEPVQDRLAAIPAVTDPLIGRMVGAGPKHGIEFVRDCRHRATQQ